MAFERLKARYQSGAKKGPATISLTGKGLPRVNLCLSSVLAIEVGILNGDKVHIALGGDDDAGKLRVEKAADGVFVAKVLKGKAVLIDCGFIEAIGTVPQKKRPTTARKISPGVAEVDIPDFSADESADDDIDDDDPRTSVAAAVVNGGVAKDKVVVDTVNGVGIDLTLDNESVTFRDKTVEVTTRQAKFVHLLARSRPAPVAVSFLVNALWDGKPPGSAIAAVNQMAADLQKALSPIGLSLILVKGASYQLKDL